ncbi:MAG: hypothetical protein P4L53_05515 [Candidatus Obscuribacterales bacterium]|nr:hypothetical protein [Candidatus Obscuribacterales bacterium]
MLDDVETSFANLFVESDHAGFLSNSLGGMSNAEIVDTFGSASVSNYEEDRELKARPSYRKDARWILARIRRVDFLLAAINQDASVISSNDRMTSEFKELLRSKINTAEYRSNLSNDELQKTLSDVLVGCANQEEQQSENERENTKKPLRRLKSHVFELSQHAHYFSNNKDDQVPVLLLELEAQKNTDLGQRNEVERQLSYAHRLLDTGLFGLEDIAREALGGTDFIKGLKKHFCEVAMNNRRDHGNDYREFYIRFGTKHFKRLIAGTLGAVLFSFDGAQKLETWTPKDVRQISNYVYSRYRLVHDVIEGLANKKVNPLGSNLTKEQTIALMCETLRAAIYPGYKTDIRVGIGGTHQSDVLVRVGAYVMNALDTMAVYAAANEVCASFKGANVPSLTLVSGTALAERVNGLDPVSGKKNEQRFFSFIGKFIASYYPELSDKVTYASPTQQEIFDNDLYKALLEAAKEITNHKNDEDQEWSETYEKRSKAAAALITLTNFASKRKQATGNEDAAKEMALQYAVAHITPPVFQSIRFAGGYTAPVWKIGGRSEKHFNAFGEALVDLLRDDERFCLPNGNYGSSLTAGICTTTTVGGNPPPYYKGSNGSFDLGLREFMKKISNGSFSDESVIARLQSEDSGPAADMRALLTHKRLGDGDIKKGWSNYRSFLMTCEH